MTSFEFVGRHTVSSNEYFLFELDEYRRGDQQFLLAHLVFHKFSPTALKRAHAEWDQLRRIVKAPFYAVRNDGDEKLWRHYISRFGFEPTDIHMPCNNGTIRQLFISTVNLHGIKHTERLNVVTDEPVGTAGSCAVERLH